MFNVKCPCKNCEDRAEACHDVCERFVAYKQAIEEVKAHRSEALRWSKPNAITRTKPKGARQ